MTGISTAKRVDRAIEMFDVGVIFSTDQICALVPGFLTRTIAGHLRRNPRVEHIVLKKHAIRGGGKWQRVA